MFQRFGCTVILEERCFEVTTNEPGCSWEIKVIWSVPQERSMSKSSSTIFVIQPIILFFSEFTFPFDINEDYLSMLTRSDLQSVTSDRKMKKTFNEINLGRLVLYSLSNITTLKKNYILSSYYWIYFSRFNFEFYCSISVLNVEVSVMEITWDSATFALHYINMNKHISFHIIPYFCLQCQKKPCNIMTLLLYLYITGK